MKLTRFGHSCVLVETALPERRVALFDPGVWSEVPLVKLDQLDEIYITHEHADHCDVSLLMRLREKFPEVRIMSTSAVAAELNKHKVAARDMPSQNSRFFGSPHEAIAPFGGASPEQIGVHYLDLFSHPGDSLSFRETCPVLALPMTGPWGATRDALALALQLKPTYIVPIHDWFWQDEARSWAYSRLEEVLAEQGITFLPIRPSESYEINDSQIGPDHYSPSLVID